MREVMATGFIQVLTIAEVLVDSRLRISSLMGVVDVTILAAGQGNCRQPWVALS